MPNRSQGHVFVVHGNITTMVVDSWILPTDQDAKIRSAFWNVFGSDHGERREEFSQAFRDGEKFAELLPWETTSPGIPVCTAVPFDGVRGTEDLRARLRAGLTLAAQVARERAADGAGPRVAMPTFGSAGGGGGRIIGSALEVYLELARECVEVHGVDVVIGCLDVATFHGLQILRCAHGQNCWPTLSEQKAHHAKRLASAARAGELTPFMGSGVSVTSGLPDWKGLLAGLREEAQLADITDADFDKLSTLDQADLIETVLGSGLKDKIAERTTTSSLGLPPILLAALPGREAVTLNYDRLFEDARQSQKGALTVIPGGQVQNGSPWLLKLHGSTDRPADIVLTRQDYLAYAASRSVLSSLAVSLLMTRHLLFVGFGFTDDHFHQLLHDVRSVYSRGDGHSGQLALGRKLGTALMLGRDPIRERLWKNYVEIITFDEGDSVPAQARVLEIFLDMVVAYAVEAPTFFLKPDYAGMLSNAERELARQLARLMEVVGEDEIRPSVKEASVDCSSSWARAEHSWRGHRHCSLRRCRSRPPLGFASGD